MTRFLWSLVGRLFSWFDDRMGHGPIKTPPVSMEDLAGMIGKRLVRDLREIEDAERRGIILDGTVSKLSDARSMVAHVRCGFDVDVGRLDASLARYGLKVGEVFGLMDYEGYEIVLETRPDFDPISILASVKE